MVVDGHGTDEGHRLPEQNVLERAQRHSQRHRPGLRGRVRCVQPQYPHHSLRLRLRLACAAAGAAASVPTARPHQLPASALCLRAVDQRRQKPARADIVRELGGAQSAGPLPKPKSARIEEGEQVSRRNARKAGQRRGRRG
jgi:ribosomal protein L44E